MRTCCSSASVLILLGLGCATVAQISDVPSLENFYRRGSASATVIGDYVYIDGGEVSQAVDGKPPGDQFRLSNPVNHTISIDLSKSWNTSDVVLRTIERPWTSKGNQVIWTDYSAGVFYLWAGKWFGGNGMTTNVIWKFTPDGSGSGSWAVEEPANPELFEGLQEADYAVYANSNSTGFAIGGISSGWSKKYRASSQAVPGMVTFDMTTKVWANGTTGFAPISSQLTAGAAHYVSKFGPNGLIVLLGGVAHPVDAEINWDTATPYNLKNLTFFDPQTKEVYWQETTGDIPPSPRSQLCWAGFQDSDGGYEIVITGGYNHRDKVLYKDTYILSLPGFVWVKAPDSPTGARRTPACVSVGNRQMLVIGGTTTGGWENKDTAPQGLALFDATELKWKDSYDLSAAAYERPAVVKAWYNNGSFDTVEWSSDGVGALFGAKGKTSQTGNSSSNSSSPGDPPVEEVQSESTPVGAIVGGVVGGLAGIAIIAAAAWLLIRRRKRAAETEAAHPSSSSANGGYRYEAPEGAVKMTATGTEMELPGKSDRIELYTERYHSELAGSVVYSAPQPHYPVMPYEMDGTPTHPRLQ